MQLIILHTAGITSLSVRSRVLPGNLEVTQQVKIFSIFHENLRFTNLFTKSTIRPSPDPQKFSSQNPHLPWYCSGGRVITAKESEPQKSRVTSLGYSGRRALRREQCGVFMPCKNRNLETCSRDYATVLSWGKYATILSSQLRPGLQSCFFPSAIRMLNSLSYLPCVLHAPSISSMILSAY
jgi:hypothetical protein